MKLIHAADIHLGRQRLDGRLPDSDFAAAFGHIANEAIAGKADVFLLAGDLFDRPQVEPPHLRQAQETLAKLKQAGIPVIAVTGNHDKSFLNSAEQTWLEYLADLRLQDVSESKLDQLLLVSHDDAFEGKIENVVLIRKTANEGSMPLLTV